MRVSEVWHRCGGTRPSGVAPANGGGRQRPSEGLRDQIGAILIEFGQPLQGLVRDRQVANFIRRLASGGHGRGLPLLPV